MYRKKVQDPKLDQPQAVTSDAALQAEPLPSQAIPAAGEEAANTKKVKNAPVQPSRRDWRPVIVAAILALIIIVGVVELMNRGGGGLNPAHTTSINTVNATSPTTVYNVNGSVGCGRVPSALAKATVGCIHMGIYVPVGVTLPTRHAEIMLRFDALGYASYLAPGLSNIYCYNTTSGQSGQCWIEGNSLNESQAYGLNTVSNVIIWLNLPENPSPGSTDSNWAIGIAAKSSDLLGNGSASIGAAPQLYCGSGCPSTTYAGADNGNLVFPFYDNFNGAVLNRRLWQDSYGDASGAGGFIMRGINTSGAANGNYMIVANNSGSLLGNNPNVSFDTLIKSDNAADNITWYWGLINSSSVDLGGAYFQSWYGDFGVPGTFPGFATCNETIGCARTDVNLSNSVFSVETIKQQLGCGRGFCAGSVEGMIDYNVVQISHPQRGSELISPQDYLLELNIRNQTYATLQPGGTLKNTIYVYWIRMRNDTTGSAQPGVSFGAFLSVT